MNSFESAMPVNNCPPRRFVWWLATTQFISWGTLHYTFALLPKHFEKDLELSRVAMCGGSLLAAVALIALSLVHGQWQLDVVWTVIGVALSGVLYRSAFLMPIRCFAKDFRGVFRVGHGVGRGFLVGAATQAATDLTRKSAINFSVLSQLDASLARQIVVCRLLANTEPSPNKP